jgi:hypothetical protein
MIGLLAGASSIAQGLGGLGGSGGLPGGGGGETSSAVSGGTFTTGDMGGAKDNSTWLLVIGLVIVLAIALSGRSHGK